MALVNGDPDQRRGKALGGRVQDMTLGIRVVDPVVEFVELTPRFVPVQQQLVIPGDDDGIDTLVAAVEYLVHHVDD
jgi:hypothetical protein